MSLILPLDICLDLASISTPMKERGKIRAALQELDPPRSLVTTVKPSTGLLVSDKKNLNHRNAIKYKVPVIDKATLYQYIDFSKSSILKECTDSDEDDFLSLFTFGEESEESETAQQFTDSTDFSFSSTYTRSDLGHDIIDEVEDPFTSDQEEENNDEFAMEEKENSKWDSSLSPSPHTTPLSTKLEGWEAGSEKQPYFPNTESEMEVDNIKRFYCPKSFLLKKKELQRITWCSLRLEFCTEGKETYYRVVESEYLKIDEIADGMVYHHYLLSLPEAERTLKSLYDYKIEVEFYVRVSVFQNAEQKKMAFYSSSLKHPSLSYSFQEPNESVYIFVESLMIQANEYISSQLEELRLHAIGGLLTPTGATITLSEILKSETILYKLAKHLQEKPEGRKSRKLPRGYINRLHLLSQHYYSTLLQSNKTDTISSLEEVCDKMKMSQLLKDMISIGEELSAFHTLTESALAYRSLRCEIQELEIHSDLFVQLSNRFLHTMPEGSIIHHIFSVHKEAESEQFLDEIQRKSIHNLQLLFHATKKEYWYSILSRGLMIPSQNPLEQLVPRTDLGKLGFGLYFSSDPSASIPYGDEHTIHNRVMLCSEVALGEVYQTGKSDFHLLSPPASFDSVQGIQSTQGMPTCFEHDEFVIYSTKQHRMKYLFEYSLPSSSHLPSNPPSIPKNALLPNIKEQITFATECQLPSTYTESSSTLPPSRPSGLIVTAYESFIDHLCQLKSVHISAEVIDCVAEVTIFQTFFNSFSCLAQAKYIFPLDDMAAVCGFEAFVNGKHINGEVVEKEEAQEIYKNAVHKGYGAYLVTQESDDRDLFCLNIGNILPHSTVIIKIKYVSELKIEGHQNEDKKICLSFPQSIRHSSLGTTSMRNEDSNPEMKIQVSFVMPFNIVELSCNVPEYKFKQTRTKASLRIENAPWDHQKDIEMSLRMEKASESRLYVEQDENGHYASMLSICPSFQWDVPEQTELIFIIDRSASMQSHFDVLHFVLDLLLSELQALPSHFHAKQSHCTFNILGFGGSFEWLFVHSTPISASSIAAARRYLEQELHPDLGGSDLWLALSACYLLGSNHHAPNSTPSSSPHRSLFVLTDGAITQDAFSRSLVEENAWHTRLFTIGIGADQKKSSVQILAQIGGGTSLSFLDCTQPAITAKKLSRQLLQSMQPSWRNIQVRWGLPGQYKGNDGKENQTDATRSFQSPSHVHSIYQGDRLLIYFLGDELYTSASISAMALHQETIFHVSCDHSPSWNGAWTEIDERVSTHEMAVTRGNLIHRLAARSIIREWENGKLYSDQELSHTIQHMLLKDSIIDLSIRYQLVSKYTAFVAVEERISHEEFINTSSCMDVLQHWSSSIVDHLDELPWNEGTEKKEKEKEGGLEGTNDGSQDGLEMDGFFDLNFWDNEEEVHCDNESVEELFNIVKVLQNSLPSGVTIKAEDFQPLPPKNIPERKVEPLYPIPPKKREKKKHQAPPAGGGYNPYSSSTPSYYATGGSSSSSGGRGRSGGAVSDHEEALAIANAFASKAGEGLEPSLLCKDKFLTPFGFQAEPLQLLPQGIQKFFAGSCVSHLFKGPLNSGKDCWLNALVMLCFSISSMRIFIHNYTKAFTSLEHAKQLRLIQKEGKRGNLMLPELLVPLEAIYQCWNSLSNSSGPQAPKTDKRFRSGLLTAQKRLLIAFSEQGYSIKDPQCVIRAFNTIEEQMRLTQSLCTDSPPLKWISLSCNSWNFSSPHWRLMKKKCQSRKQLFIIVCNEEYSELPSEFLHRDGSLSDRVSMNGYQLHSFISFEHMNNDVNHFNTFCLLEGNGYVLYNDILHFGRDAGGYQGGVFNLPSPTPLDHPGLKQIDKARAMVPITIFKRK